MRRIQQAPVCVCACACVRGKRMCQGTGDAAAGKVLGAGGGWVAPQMPSGSIIMYGVASAPTGWLVCDGTAVSRTTYAALYAAIGTTFGVGNGTTTSSSSPSKVIYQP